MRRMSHEVQCQAAYLYVVAGWKTRDIAVELGYAQMTVRKYLSSQGVGELQPLRTVAEVFGLKGVTPCDAGK